MSIIVATMAVPPFWEKEAVLLVESLLTFGGYPPDQPIIIITRKDKPLTKKNTQKLDALGVEWAEIEMDEDSRNFPLAMVAHGAAAAEQVIQNRTGLLVWLLPDTLVLQEPRAFLLPTDQRLGYRPVHHQNIGSSFQQPPDAFWQRVFQHCAVPPEHIFQMDTCYRETVRPYLNAGILVTHPEDQLMGAWLETFLETFKHPDFVPFFKQRKYAIFMHQAILAGVVLQKYAPGQLAELPESYNYPLHMHTNYPEPGRAATLNQLVTVRYEKTRLLPKFLKDIHIDPPLSAWLREKNLRN